jgi:hypothetical protein
LRRRLAEVSQRRGEARQVRDYCVRFAQLVAAEAPGRHGNATAAGGVGGRNVERCISHRHGPLRRPIAGAGAREREQLDAILALTTERALPVPEELRKAQSVESRMRNCRRIAREDRRPLDCGKCVGGAGSDLPVTRIGGGKQADVVGRKGLAPKCEPGVDFLLGKACAAKRAARMRRRRVTGYVGGSRRSSEDLLQRECVGLDVDLVMREQQRSVDID